MTQRIIKAVDGPLAGYNVIEGLDMAEYRRFTGMCVSQGMRYGWGCKPQYLNSKVVPVMIDELGKYGPVGGHVNRVDCSGFQRAAIFFATDGSLVLPDGSAVQGDFLKEHFKKSTFESMRLADGVLRIAIHRIDHADPQGHIWAAHGVPGHDDEAKSYESWGGHGPGTRDIDSPPLRRIVTEVYAVGYDPRP